jgi:hypothetical protein
VALVLLAVVAPVGAAAAGSVSVLSLASSGDLREPVVVSVGGRSFRLDEDAPRMSLSVEFEPGGRITVRSLFGCTVLDSMPVRSGGRYQLMFDAGGFKAVRTRESGWDAVLIRPPRTSACSLPDTSTTAGVREESWGDASLSGDFLGMIFAVAFPALLSRRSTRQGFWRA